jgi:arsenate reductase
MTEVVIYHNPKCSKSRQTMALLEERGIKPTVVKYLETPPTATKLKALLSLLGMAPRELMRKNEAPYKELELAKVDLSEDQLVRAMVANPVLIERPIVEANGKAAVGRPPERVLEIL